MKASVLPVDHWPNYLKLALSVGTPQENKLAQALNSILLNISLYAGAEVLSSHPSLLSSDQKRTVLNGLGFSCSLLKPSEINILYSERDRLISLWGTPRVLIRLAHVYLGNASLLRGHDFKSQILHSERLGNIRLSELNARERVITVLVNKESLKVEGSNYEGRVAAYIKTAKSFCPHDQLIQVKLVKELIKKPTNKLKIKSDLRLMKWRMA